MENSLKKFTWAGIFWTLGAGSLLHFLYPWTGRNFFAGLLAPVNETVWEHMKLLLFPFLGFLALEEFYLGRERRDLFQKNLLGLGAGLAEMPLLFYGYTFFTGKNYLWADILIFFLCILTAFGIPYSLRKRSVNLHRRKLYGKLLWAVVGIFFGVSLFFMWAQR